jgi:phosphatidylglycerophosphatase A
MPDRAKLSFGTGGPLSSLLRWALLFVVTCGFVGYLPVAPGTWATLVGAFFLYLLPEVFGSPFFAAGFVVFAVICVNGLTFTDKDPGYVVVDELAGICTTMAGHNPSLITIGAGFVLFRFFDIMKPFPIRQAERLHGGYGVVADDVVAGLFANISLWAAYAAYGALGGLK